MESQHRSVLLEEWLSFLEDQPLSTVLDLTVGAGGHAAAVLEAHPEIERFIAVDQDQSALELAKERLKPWKKVTFVRDNFAHLSQILKDASVESVDAILIDLGVSSMQLDRPERGFSFLREGPLDMRMDQEAGLTAQEIVNHWSEEELGRVFRDYGEEKLWKRAARLLVQAREEKEFETTRDLIEALQPLERAKKKRDHHPMTLIFQGLRIAVNSELEVIRRVLPHAIEVLRPGGILGVISFHSLEDRIVKKLFQHEASDKQDTRGLAGLFLEKEPTIKLLTKKPVVAKEEEIQMNPRSRSAKLRVVEKR